MLIFFSKCRIWNWKKNGKKSTLNVNILAFKTLKNFKKNNFSKKMSNKELEKNI